jgi:hypothetical protein
MSSQANQVHFLRDLKEDMVPERTTTEEQVEAVKKLCKDLEAVEHVEAAWVNDWGRYSNFNIRFTKRKVRGVTYRHILNKLRAMCKERGMTLRAYFTPHPKDYHQSCSADIDFLKYDPEANRFSA